MNYESRIMNNGKIKEKAGFTLIEVVIYSTILAIISVFVVNSLFLMIKNFNAYRVSRFVNVSTASVMERITRETREAGDIGSTNTFDSNPGHLSLDTGVEFFVTDNRLIIKEDGNDNFLTPENLQLISLIFRQVATSTNPNSKAIKIEIEIKGEKGSYQKTEKFYDTIILRNSYTQ